jgi:hypothetical protein
MKTVLAVRVTAVVGNVSVECGDTAKNALSVRKTSAKDGAGTLTWHVPEVALQFTVCTSTVPCRRPSDSKLFPNVYGMVSRAYGGALRTAHLVGPRKIPLGRNGQGTQVSGMGLELEDTQSLRTYLTLTDEGVATA